MSDEYDAQAAAPHRRSNQSDATRPDSSSPRPGGDLQAGSRDRRRLRDDERDGSASTDLHFRGDARQDLRGDKRWLPPQDRAPGGGLTVRVAVGGGQPGASQPHSSGTRSAGSVSERRVQLLPQWDDGLDDVPFGALARRNAGYSSSSDGDEEDAPDTAAARVLPVDAEHWAEFPGIHQVAATNPHNPRYYLRNKKLVKVSCWVLTIWDAAWCTHGLPYDESNSPDPAVMYICGKPELCKSTTPAGTPRLHFQGFVAFHTPTSWDDVGVRLKVGKYWCRAAGKNYVTHAISYTQKKRSGVKMVENGVEVDAWREWGKLDNRMFRGQERFANIVKQLQNGGSFVDILRTDPMAAVMHSAGISKALAALAVPHQRPKVETYLLYGPTNVGKTFAINNFLEYCPDPEEHENNMYTKMSKAGSDKDWWDGYHRQQAVCIDEFRDYCYPIISMLRYLCEAPMRMEIKGGSVCAYYTRVYISSNHPIESWYKNEQKDPDGKRNYEALVRRIPPENRVHVNRRVDGPPRKMSWQEFKDYQNRPMLEPPKEVGAEPAGVAVLLSAVLKVLSDEQREKLKQLL